MTKDLLIALCFTTTFAYAQTPAPRADGEHVTASSTLSPFLQSNSNTPQGIQLKLTAPEKQDLPAFLHMLTDSSFITDNRFSDPFINQ